MDQLQEIVFSSFIDELKTNETKKIYFPPYKELLDTVGNFIDDDGTVVHNMHANNSAKWLQKFVNGYIQESTLKSLNSRLEFIEDNHEKLTRGSTGSNIPDFKFNLDSIEYTLETKIYTEKTSFDNIEYGKSFHGAKFVLAFILDEGKYYWRVRINDDVYSYSATMANNELSDQMKKFVGWIKLPSSQTMLRLNVPSDMTDDQLPDEITYTFRTIQAK